jgi:hypothetical protein
MRRRGVKAAYDCINENRVNLVGVLERASSRVGFVAVDILFVLGSLLVAFVFVVFSCARSYFERGRLRGMEEAIRELAKGINSHFELDGNALPERVAVALKGFKAASWKASRPGKELPHLYHAQLWIVGDAIGEACWLKGHAAGMRRRAPAEGKIRVDFSLNELLQLSWLAHLGFRHMMPNYRDFEIHRFNGQEDALEGALAVGKIEAAVPTKDRPFADLLVQFKRRQTLIYDWWQAVVPDRITA